MLLYVTIISVLMSWFHSEHGAAALSYVNDIDIPQARFVFDKVQTLLYPVTASMPTTSGNTTAAALDLSKAGLADILSLPWFGLTLRPPPQAYNVGANAGLLASLLSAAVLLGLWHLYGAIQAIFDTYPSGPWGRYKRHRSDTLTYWQIIPTALRNQVQVWVCALLVFSSALHVHF
jgi:hypothetical protein